jgi:O-antigen/teichoic acid export membrane protein
VFNKLIIKNGIIYVGFEVLNKALPFILLPILTHYISPTGFGLIANFNAIYGVLTVLVGLSIHGAVNVAYFKYGKSEISTYVFNSLIILTASFFAIFLVSVILSNTYKHFSNLPIYWLYIGIAAAAMQFVTSINLVLWQAEKNALNYGTYQLIQTLLNFLLSIWLVIIATTGWEGRLYAQNISVISFAVISLYILYKRKYLLATINKKYIIDALKFGIPLIPHSLSGWIFMGFNILLITAVLGEDQAGIYSVAMQFALIMNIIVNALNRAVQPFFYERLMDIDNFKKVLLVKYVYLGFIAMTIMGILVTLLTTVIIRIFVDEQYYNATTYIPYLVFSAVFNGFYLLVVKFIFYINKTYYVTLATFFSAMIHLILTVTLINLIGLLGVAIATMITSVISFVITWYISSRIFPMPWRSFVRT